MNTENAITLGVYLVCVCGGLMLMRYLVHLFGGQDAQVFFPQLFDAAQFKLSVAGFFAGGYLSAFVAPMVTGALGQVSGAGLVIAALFFVLPFFVLGVRDLGELRRSNLSRLNKEQGESA